MWVSFTIPGHPVKLVVPFEAVGMNQWVQICADTKHFKVATEKPIACSSQENRST
jgi:hypothetical protein